ncbi:hypothetical protein LCGC14_0775490 [marine sediment metagenome]|uniref:Uncharacterized protein n=1 Tax=marine sediment metagenome TaxID=412755 RepID=A0A0F9Q1C5_9ZZZZ
MGFWRLNSVKDGVASSEVFNGARDGLSFIIESMLNDGATKVQVKVITLDEYLDPDGVLSGPDPDTINREMESLKDERRPL